MSSPEFRDDFYGVSDAVHASLVGYLFDETNGPRSVDVDDVTIGTDSGYGIASTGVSVYETKFEPVYLLAIDAVSQIFPDKVQETPRSTDDPLLRTLTIKDAQAVTDGVIRFMADARRNEVIDG